MSGGGGRARPPPKEYYEQFDLDKYEKDSFEWKRAMIKMLLELKKDGHEIKEIVNGSGNKVSAVSALTFVEGDSFPCV